QDLDQFDVAQGRHETGDGPDVGGIVGEAGYQDVADPDRLADRREPLGETQRRCEVGTGDTTVCVWVARFDVEQNQVDLLEIGIIRAGAEKARRIKRGVQAEPLRGREYTSREAALNKGLAAGYCQPSAHAAKSRSKIGEPLDGRVDTYAGAALEVPGVRIVTVLAPQEAAGQEQGCANTGAIDRRARFQRMDVADGARLVGVSFGFRRVRRTRAAEIVPAGGNVPAGFARYQGLSGHQTP